MTAAWPWEHICKAVMRQLRPKMSPNDFLSQSESALWLWHPRQIFLWACWSAWMFWIRLEEVSWELFRGRNLVYAQTVAVCWKSQQKSITVQILAGTYLLKNICPPCLQKPILNNEGLAYHPTYPGKDFVAEINGDKTGEPYLFDGHSLHTLHRETYRPAPLKSRQRFNQHRNLITCGLEIALPTTLPAIPLPREMGLSRQ